LANEGASATVAPCIMKLEVLHRDQNQAIGIYGEVYLVVRWDVFATADLVYHRSALAKLQERNPGGIAFLQVNRFGSSRRIAMDDGAQAAMMEIVRTFGTAVCIVAVVLPNEPFEAASLRSMLSRMALSSRLRLDVRVLNDMVQAVNEVTEKLTASGLSSIRPADLLAALSELELLRPPAR